MMKHRLSNYTKIANVLILENNNNDVPMSAMTELTSSSLNFENENSFDQFKSNVIKYGELNDFPKLDK